MDEGRKDIIGGGLLMLVGVALAIHCYATYDLGSLRRLGTGAFPLLAGALLALLGAAVAAPPLMRKVKPGLVALPPMRSTLFVISAVAAFALLVRPFGLFPAIAALATLSSLASPERTPVRDLAAMIAGLCMLAWIVFGLGMSLGLRMIDWPW